MSTHRTTIEIDDQLLEIVMNRHGIKSKSKAVNLALRSLADYEGRMTRAEVLAMQGSGFIDEDPSQVMMQARN